MKCPNCGREMKDKSYNYYEMGDWDMDYPSGYCEKYVCFPCKIKYVDRKWIVPKSLAPTDKQIKCVDTINYYLGTNFEPIIKSKTTKFISEHISKSYEVRKEYQEHRDEFYDYGDFTNEYEYY